MATVRAADLILDLDVYPRASGIDDGNVASIVHAMQAGKQMPAVIVDRKTLRVVDGFHRVTAALKLRPDVATVEVEYRTYKDDATFLADAIAFNAAHGKRLGAIDHARCVLLAEAYGLSTGKLAEALGMTPDRAAGVRMRKVAVDPQQRFVPIKYTLQHLAGKELTQRQVEGNTAASGMSPTFMILQILNLLDHDLVDRTNLIIMQRLADLHARLGAFLDGVPVAPAPEPVAPAADAAVAEAS